MKNIHVTSSQHEHKYIGWIFSDRYHPLWSSDPIYDSYQEAEQAMYKGIAELKQKIKPETKKV